MRARANLRFPTLQTYSPMYPLAAALLLAFSLALCFLLRQKRTRSTFDLVPGVRGHHFWGNYHNMADVLSDKALGSVFVFHGLLNRRKLCVRDLTAASFILNDGTEFDRPLVEGRRLEGLLGL